MFAAHLLIGEGGTAMLVLREESAEKSTLALGRASVRADEKLSETSALALDADRSMSLTRLKLPAD